jgi:hypothetical protein
LRRDAVFDPFAMVFEGKELDLLGENSNKDRTIDDLDLKSV